MKEKINYEEFALDPSKDVLVKPEIFVELQRFINMVKTKHTEYKFPQQTTWYDKKNHLPIDNTKKKLTEDKLKENYYRNVNILTTEKKGEVVYDELSLSSIKLLAAIEEVFRYNVDQGNALLRPKDNSTKLESSEELPASPGSISESNES